MLLSGKFRWFFRRRLRITLTGDPEKINQPPVELKEQQLQYPEYRYMDLMSETRDPKCGGRSAREWARPLFSKFTYKLVSFMWAKSLHSGRSQLKLM